MADVILDAFLDSLKVLAVVAVCTYIIALIEPLLSKRIRLHGKLAPLIGVSISLLPQCGFSIVAADLYQKRHLTVGTLIGVFLATSDEALPVFLSYPNKALHVLPILLCKFLLGLIIGYSIDFIFSKSRKSVNHHVKHCTDDYRIRLMHCESAERVEKNGITECCSCEECFVSQCSKNSNNTHTIQDSCNHNHLDNNLYNKENNHTDEVGKKNTIDSVYKDNKSNEVNGILRDYLKKYSRKKAKKEKLDRFIIKPLLHSLEIFLYVLIINLIFGIIILYIGRDNIINFLLLNKYIAPLLSVIIGVIPNCASSIIISELYIMGGLGFGATLGGLSMNAGLGFLFLFKDTKHLKRSFSILLITFFISLSVAYIFSAIFNFGSFTAF